jgi:hypothetical protein
MDTNKFIVLCDGGITAAVRIESLKGGMAQYEWVKIKDSLALLIQKCCMLR